MINNTLGNTAKPQRGSSTDSMGFPVGCPRQGTIETDSASFSKGTVETDSVSFPSNSRHCESRMRYNTPPYMAKAFDRLISFNQSSWMKYIVDPQALSDAGFYYTGVGDKVKCFCCDGVIGDWNFTDNPWEEHAFWFPNCKFVVAEKGNMFVASIKKKWMQHLKMMNSNKHKLDNLIYFS